jgi:hypothetical protein
VTVFTRNCLGTAVLLLGAERRRALKLEELTLGTSEERRSGRSMQPYEIPQDTEEERGKSEMYKEKEI